MSKNFRHYCREILPRSNYFLNSENFLTCLWRNSSFFLDLKWFPILLQRSSSGIKCFFLDCEDFLILLWRNSSRFKYVDSGYFLDLEDERIWSVIKIILATSSPKKKTWRKFLGKNKAWKEKTWCSYTIANYWPIGRPSVRPSVHLSIKKVFCYWCGEMFVRITVGDYNYVCTYYKNFLHKQFWMFIHHPTNIC